MEVSGCYRVELSLPHKPRLATLQRAQCTLRNVKELVHYSQRAGHGIPSGLFSVTKTPSTVHTDLGVSQWKEMKWNLINLFIFSMTARNGWVQEKLSARSHENAVRKRWLFTGKVNGWGISKSFYGLQEYQSCVLLICLLFFSFHRGSMLYRINWVSNNIDFLFLIAGRHQPIRYHSFLKLMQRSRYKKEQLFSSEWLVARWLVVCENPATWLVTDTA